MKQDHIRFEQFVALGSKLHVSANALPGRLVLFSGFEKRERPVRRKICIISNGTNFFVEVPIDLGRTLKSNECDDSPEAYETLARCFERAFLAQMPEGIYHSFGLDANEPYEIHRRNMHEDGSIQLAYSLRDGLGEHLYYQLLDAVEDDLRAVAKLERRNERRPRTPTLFEYA